MVSVVQRVKAVPQFVVDVFRDEHHFLDDLVFETKFREQRLQLGVQLLKFGMFPFALGVLMRRTPVVVMAIRLLVEFPGASDDALQSAQMFFAIVDFVVLHHAVKAFARRIGQ